MSRLKGLLMGNLTQAPSLTPEDEQCLRRVHTTNTTTSQHSHSPALVINIARELEKRNIKPLSNTNSFKIFSFLTFSLAQIHFLASPNQLSKLSFPRGLKCEVCNVGLLTAERGNGGASFSPQYSLSWWESSPCSPSEPVPHSAAER